jgi:GT2 family glycosyltransferase
MDVGQFNPPNRNAPGGSLPPNATDVVCNAARHKMIEQRATTNTQNHASNVPFVGVIVVNWNRKEDTLRGLRALDSAEYAQMSVLLVDNASTDDSVAVIKDTFPDLAVLALDDNLGFTGGYNAGIRYFMERDTDYVLLINNDAVLAPDALQKLVDSAETNPNAALFSAEVRSIEQPERIIFAGGTLQDGWMVRHDRLGQAYRDCSRQPYTTDFLSGCVVMARCNRLQEIGLLDEDFFMYFEDVEWSYRTQQHGYDLLVVPDAVAWHPDTRDRDTFSKRITYYSARNALLFARRQQLSWRTKLSIWHYHLRMALSWTVKPRWRDKRPQRDVLILALFDYLRGNFGRSDRL